ncbi:MAG: N-formylglutamate amidohydrolase [Pseudomonadota bacterium]
MTDPVLVVNPDGKAPVVLVCEHASPVIPSELARMGLSAQAALSHIAWDPGAMAVAEQLSAMLDAPLVAGTLSRLLYDCNRPPEAPDAIPTRSEIYDIPRNASLSASARTARIRSIYEPFSEKLEATIKRRMGTRPPALVTIHSFTPVYMGKIRKLEIGILNDEDTRLADALLAAAVHHPGLRFRRNEPYGPGDGVTHTLKRHGLQNGLPNAMIEIRNDLIATAPQQQGMARLLQDLLHAALPRVQAGVA